MALFLEQALNVTTTATYYWPFPHAITSAGPPILAVQAWNNSVLFFDSVQYSGGPGSWTGATLSFAGNGGHTSQIINVRIYAYNLPLLSGYGIRIRNEYGSVVFDSLRKPLVFTAELGGTPQDWVSVSGRPIAGGARIDIYRPAFWGQGSNAYIAVGMALDVELGQLTINGAVHNAITFYRWGFSGGEPRLMLDSRTGMPATQPGIPSAVYYSMPAIPIIRD